MGTSLWLKEVYFCFLLRIKLVMLGSVLVLPHYWVVRTFFFIAFFSYCLILYGTIRYKNIFEIFCWGKLFPSPKSVYFVLHKLGGYFMLFIFAWGSYFIPWSCLLSFLSLTVHQSPLCVHGNRILCIHTKLNTSRRSHVHCPCAGLVSCVCSYPSGEAVATAFLWGSHKVSELPF